MTENQPENRKHSYGINFIENHWRPLTFVSIVMLLVASGLLVLNAYSTGSFMDRDIELTGGKQISIALSNPVNIDQLRSSLPSMKIRLSGSNLIIETSPNTDDKAIISKLSELGAKGETSVRSIGPLLGELFWQQAQLAIIIAFILMSLVIFIIFRSPAPSLAVMLAAITDIVVTMAILNFLEIKLSMAVLAGLLMLIGYSVDTDIVLTTEFLKSSRKEIPDRFKSAFKTGITMTGSAIAALLAMYLVSGNLILQQIALVLIIGLLIDVPSTWLGNAGILRWWTERKEKKMVK